MRFLIREMQPIQQENWLFRALSIMVPDPDAPAEQYLEAVRDLAAGDFQKLAPHVSQEALDLWNGLSACCRLLVDGRELPCTHENIDAHVEDVRTLYQLKSAALAHNAEFLRMENHPEAGQPEVDLLAAFTNIWHFKEYEMNDSNNGQPFPSYADVMSGQAAMPDNIIFDGFIIPPPPAAEPGETSVENMI